MKGTILIQIDEMKKLIQQQLLQNEELKKLLVQQQLRKEALTFTEAALYLNLSESYLYQMVSQQKIPSYKPNGKKLYFSRIELDKWLLSNKQNSLKESRVRALNFLSNNKIA